MNSLATPLVSVVIPAWNAAATLGETLESVRTQTFADFEVIVVDDGSADETAAIVRRFCSTDPRFILQQQTNRGQAIARNAGIAQARGEYVAFLDADDVWRPEKLAKQLEIFRTEPQANLVFTNYFLWDGTHDLELFFREDRRLPSGPASRSLIWANLYIPSIVMVRRSLFETGCRFAPGTAGCSDWDLWLQFLEHGLWAVGTREPLARYRQWEGNMSRRKLEMCEEGVQVLENRGRLTQKSELRVYYRQSLAFARGRLELARARKCLETTPETVPAFIWRAWRFYPRQIKWLGWFLFTVWPKWLGGESLRRVVHKKLRAKF